MPSASDASLAATAPGAAAAGGLSGGDERVEIVDPDGPRAAVCQLDGD